MLHVHCGDCSADVQRQSDLPGDIIVWCDPVSAGPAPRGLSLEQWRELRAEYLVESTGHAMTREACIAWQARQDAALERLVDHEEVVFWFDGCMYDQTILIRHLDWLSRRERGVTTLSLIDIGEFPGKPDFVGLGELNAQELASLFPKRVPIDEECLSLGRDAWEAYGSPDPREIESLLASHDISPLPHLPDALWRHLQQFPALANGLNRLESEALQAIRDGHRRLREIFRYASQQEERPFFGDTTLWWTLHQLADCAIPLVSIDDGQPLPLWQPPAQTADRTVTLTETGVAVLEKQADFVVLNGIDRWIGGVHLRGQSIPWRFDNAHSRLEHL